MKAEMNISKGLAQSAFVMNVLGGGMSKPKSKLKKLDDHYLLKLNIPGVDAEQLSVEINNQHLFIFQIMNFKEDVEIPYMVQRILIPVEVNFDEIRAEYEKGDLHVILPFSEMAGGYQRHVDIEKH